MNPDPAPVPGTWHSAYEYESSSRGQTLTDERDVILAIGGHQVQQDVTLTIYGSQVRVRPLPDSPSRLEMDLSFDRSILAGFWSERTDQAGYYRGHLFTGTVLFIIAEDGRSMAGRWIGADRNLTEVNTGTWTLTWVRQQGGHA